MEAADGITIALGATTTGFLVREGLAWLRARSQKSEIAPTPLPVTTEKIPKYVTVQEFNKHLEDNARDHENLFGRLNRNDRETSEIRGLLTGMREDLTAIKHKLFKTR